MEEHKEDSREDRDRRAEGHAQRQAARVADEAASRLAAQRAARAAQSNEDELLGLERGANDQSTDGDAEFEAPGQLYRGENIDLAEWTGELRSSSRSLFQERNAPAAAPSLMTPGRRREAETRQEAEARRSQHEQEQRSYAASMAAMQAETQEATQRLEKMQAWQANFVKEMEEERQRSRAAARALEERFQRAVELRDRQILELRKRARGQWTPPGSMAEPSERLAQRVDDDGREYKEGFQGESEYKGDDGLSSSRGQNWKSPEPTPAKPKQCLRMDESTRKLPAKTLRPEELAGSTKLRIYRGDVLNDAPKPMLKEASREKAIEFLAQLKVRRKRERDLAEDGVQMEVAKLVDMVSDTIKKLAAGRHGVDDYENVEEEHIEDIVNELLRMKSTARETIAAMKGYKVKIDLKLPPSLRMVMLAAEFKTWYRRQAFEPDAKQVVALFQRSIQPANVKTLVNIDFQYNKEAKLFKKHTSEGPVERFSRMCTFFDHHVLFEGQQHRNKEAVEAENGKTTSNTHGGAAGGAGGGKKKAKEPCRQHKKGRCTRGDKCKFSHDDTTARTGKPNAEKPCRDLAKGNCKYGDACKFSHKKQPESRSRGQGDRRGTSNKPNGLETPKPPCFNWQNKGECSYGDKCKFSHDGPKGSANLATMAAAENADTPKIEELLARIAALEEKAQPEQGDGLNAMRTLTAGAAAEALKAQGAHADDGDFLFALTDQTQAGGRERYDTRRRIAKVVGKSGRGEVTTHLLYDQCASRNFISKSATKRVEERLGLKLPRRATDPGKVKLGLGKIAIDYSEEVLITYSEKRKFGELVQKFWFTVMDEDTGDVLKLIVGEKALRSLGIKSANAQIDERMRVAAQGSEGQRKIFNNTTAGNPQGGAPPAAQAALHKQPTGTAPRKTAAQQLAAMRNAELRDSEGRAKKPAAETKPKPEWHDRAARYRLPDDLERQTMGSFWATSSVSHLIRIDYFIDPLVGCNYLSETALERLDPEAWSEMPKDANSVCIADEKTAAILTGDGTCETVPVVKQVRFYRLRVTTNEGEQIHLEDVPFCVTKEVTGHDNKSYAVIGLRETVHEYNDKEVGDLPFDIASDRDADQKECWKILGDALIELKSRMRPEEVPPDRFYERLESILRDNLRAFGTKLCKGPPMNCEPLKLRFKEGAPGKGRHPGKRKYNPVALATMQRRLAELVAAGVMYGPLTREQQAQVRHWIALHMADRSDLGKEPRLTFDATAQNSLLIKEEPGRMSIDELMAWLPVALFYIDADDRDGYSQGELHPDNWLDMVTDTPFGVYMMKRVPQGTLNAVSWYQQAQEAMFGDMTGVDENGKGKGLHVNMDDKLLYTTGKMGIVDADVADGLTPEQVAAEEMLILLQRLLKRCIKHNLILSPTKFGLFKRELEWMGKWVSRDGIGIAPRRVQGWDDQSHPRTVADVMKFIGATTWSRARIPHFARIVHPLRVFVKTAMEMEKKKTSRVAEKKLIGDWGWGVDEENAYLETLEAVRNSIVTSHPRRSSDWCCVFVSDASDTDMGWLLAQVPKEDLVKDFTEWRVELLAVGSHHFKPVEYRYAMVDKEAMPLPRLYPLRHLWWGEVLAVGDAANITLLFNAAMDKALSAASSSRLTRTALKMMHLPVRHMHIDGSKNLFADWLSRGGAPRRNRGMERRGHPNAKAESERRERETLNVMVLSDEIEYTDELQRGETNAAKWDPLWQMPPGKSNPHSMWPGLKEIRECQEEYFPPHEAKRVAGGMAFDGKREVWTLSDRVVIPRAAKELQRRIIIVAHQGSAGHRGQEATIAMIRKHFRWGKTHAEMETSIKALLGTCLQCLKTAAGEVVTRPLGSSLVAERPGEITSFDWMKVGDASVLVLMDKFSGLVALSAHKTQKCIPTARKLLRWHGHYGLADYYVSDNGQHFCNQVIEKICDKLNVKHAAVLAAAPWANGAVERCNALLLKVLRALLSEWEMPDTHWPVLIPVVEFVLNHSPRPRLANKSPIEAMSAIVPRSNAEAVLLRDFGDAVKQDRVTAFDWEAIRDKHFKELTGAVEAMRAIVSKSDEDRRNRNNRGRGELPRIQIGDYVLVGTVFVPGGSKRPDARAKARVRWGGPFVVTDAVGQWVWEVALITRPPQDLTPGRDGAILAHVNRIRRYSDSSLNVTEALVNVAINDAAFNTVEKIVDWRPKNATSWKGLEFRCQWLGYTPGTEDTWEPITALAEDIRVYLKKYIRGESKSRACTAKQKKLLASALAGIVARKSTARKTAVVDVEGDLVESDDEDLGGI